MNFNINKESLMGQKITVIGLKKSGYAAAVLGHELGANIFVSEINNDTEIIFDYALDPGSQSEGVNHLLSFKGNFK